MNENYERIYYQWQFLGLVVGLGLGLLYD